MQGVGETQWRAAPVMFEEDRREGWAVRRWNG